MQSSTSWLIPQVVFVTFCNVILMTSVVGRRESNDDLFCTIFISSHVPSRELEFSGAFRFVGTGNFYALLFSSFDW